MTYGLSTYNLLRPTNHDTTTGGDWRDEAACVDVTPDLFYTDTASAIGQAKDVCRACPVRANCLADAMRDERDLGPGSRFGIFGGLTANERARRARHA